MGKKLKAKSKTKCKRGRGNLQKPGRAPKNERWDIFALEYSVDQNGTRAYGVAYPDASPDTCRSAAPALIANPSIRSRIRNIIAERKSRILIKGDELLLKIQEQALADPRRLFDEEGCVLPVSEWPDDLAGAIAGLEVKENIHPFTGKVTGYVKKIKFWDKPKSQEMLGRNQKLFGEAETKVTVTVVTIDEAEARALLKKIHDDC